MPGTDIEASLGTDDGDMRAADGAGAEDYAEDLARQLWTSSTAGHEMINGTENFTLTYSFYNRLTHPRLKYPTSYNVQVTNTSQVHALRGEPDQTMAKARIWIDSEDYDDGSKSSCGASLVPSKLETTDFRASICGDELFFIPRHSAVRSTADFSRARDVGDIVPLWDDAKGALYLSGNATVTQYTEALRSVFYHPSMDLSLNHLQDADYMSMRKRIYMQVHDHGGVSSNIVWRNVSLTTAKRVYTDVAAGAFTL